MYILELIKLAKEVCPRRYIIVYPNSGEKWEDKQWVTGTSTLAEQSELESLVRTWYEAGARIIGGCCRTKPGTIKVISQTLAKCAERIVGSWFYNHPCIKGFTLSCSLILAKNYVGLSCHIVLTHGSVGINFYCGFCNPYKTSLIWGHLTIYMRHSYIEGNI